MYYSDELIEEVRERTDIVNLISSYISLKRNGSNYVGLCPFHNEKTPSFSVSPQKQMYYCFGCGVGGNVFTFVMEYDNVSFMEALTMLAEKAGVPLPELDESNETKRKKELKNRLYDIHSDAATFYYSLLKSDRGKYGYDYFRNRGLTDETIQKFGLGFSGKNSNLYTYLSKKGYTDQELRMSGLIVFDERYGPKEKFWNRVMFPIMDLNNRVIAFGGRVMGDGLPKYLNSPETTLFDKSRNLYGINYARHSRSKYFILCEGYMDVIALHQAGLTCACASLGTSLTGMQANLIKRYVDTVIISYDSDEAGIKAALRAISILKNAGISVRILNMSPYKDPDEFIKNLGKDEYIKRIENAQKSFDFEITVMEKKYDFKDPEQKTAFYNEMAKRLLAFEDELERNNYIDAMAVRYNIRTEDIKKLVAKQSANVIGIREKKYDPVKKDNKETGIEQAQGFLITWITNEPSLLDKLKGVIDYMDFSDEPYTTVAKYIFDQYEKERKISPARIINKYEDVNDQNVVAGLFNRHLPEENLDKSEKEKVLNEIVKRIRKHNIDRLTRSATTSDELQKLMTMMADLQKMYIYL